MNLYIKDLNEKNPTFYFLDCEYSGINDVIGDAIVSIIYQAVLTAYLGPKYHSAQFGNSSGLDEARKKFEYMKRHINASNNDDFITLDGINKFGTSYIRRKIVHLFINSYLDPLLQRTKEEFSVTAIELENKIKSCIIMRLIGVYNIALMEPIDQAKILCLLFKTVATPVKIDNSMTTLTKLENAI